MHIYILPILCLIYIVYILISQKYAIDEVTAMKHQEAAS